MCLLACARRLGGGGDHGQVRFTDRLPRGDQDTKLRASWLVVTVLLAGSRAVAAPPAGYYDTVDDSSSAAMRTSLHEIIDDHTVIPYSSSQFDTWDAVVLLDESPTDSSKVLDVYRNRLFDKTAQTTAWNREHVWPNSRGFDDQGSSPPYTDLHHMFAADIGYNGSTSRPNA